MRILGYIAAFISLLGYGVPLYAQCPQGMPNTPGCIPPDEMNRQGLVVRDPSYSSGYRVPQQYWVEQHGAIAMDKAEPSIGVTGVDNMRSQRQAERSAVSSCRRKGGRDCQVVTTYSNTCGALAWGDVWSYTENGSSSQEAASKAMERCVGETSNCNICYQGCSLPVLRSR
jgi:hypothetical protein